MASNKNPRKRQRLNNANSHNPFQEIAHNNSIQSLHQNLDSLSNHNNNVSKSNPENIKLSLHHILQKGATLLFKVQSKRIKTLQQLNKYQLFLDTANINDYDSGKYGKTPFWINIKFNQFQIQHPQIQEDLNVILAKQCYNFNINRLQSVISSLKNAKSSYDNDIKKLINLTIDEFKKFCSLKLMQITNLNNNNENKNEQDVENENFVYDFRNLSLLNDILPRDGLVHVHNKNKTEFGDLYQKTQINHFYELVAHQNNIILQKHNDNMLSDVINPAFINNKNSNNTNNPQSNKWQNRHQNNNQFSQRKYHRKNNRNKYHYKHSSSKKRSNKFKSRRNHQFNIPPPQNHHQNYHSLNQDLINLLPSYSKIKSKLNTIYENNEEDIDMNQNNNNNRNQQ